MTKKEIVKTISERMKLTQLQTKDIVQRVFDAIVDTLVEEERIELRNFGVFEVKERAARKARNPRTGARVDVEKKFVVTFKPGKKMEERVRQLKELKSQGLSQAEAHALVDAEEAAAAAAEGRAEAEMAPLASANVENSGMDNAGKETPVAPGVGSSS